MFDSPYWKAYESDLGGKRVVVFHPFGYPFGAVTHPDKRPDLIYNPPACVLETAALYPFGKRHVIIYDPAQNKVVETNPIITR